MDPKDRNGRVAGISREEDHEIAADAAAMGTGQISRSTGTGGPDSGLAAGRDRGVGRTSHAGTTGGATGREDVGEYVDPTAALSGGTGIAGSGAGTGTTAAGMRGVGGGRGGSRGR